MDEQMSTRPSRRAKEEAIESMSTPTQKRIRAVVEPEAPPAESSQEPFSELDPSSDNDFQPPVKKGRGRGGKKEVDAASPANRRGGRAGRGRGTTPRAEQHGMVTPGPAPVYAPTPRTPHGAGGEEEEGTLFDIVRSGRVALQSTVDEWIESYKGDRDGALLTLIQFFISCSGCRGRVSPQMYSTLEHADIIRRMTEEFDEDSGEYPLITTGQQWKKFKPNFCEFVSLIVKQGQYSVIYDQYLMDNLISVLTGLTDSQVRAFRHTSTLAAMKLMTALVDVALGLSIALDNTQRQYEAERSKAASRRAPERLETLTHKRQELEENQEEIRNMLAYIFKGVFVHRYRDTVPDIRSVCMAEIGLWMKRYPKMFLDDSYLKYVGWTVYDKVGDVRLQCLKSLQSLYESEELSNKLELFTNRFKDRIVEMTLDKEYEVAVQGVRLLISIQKFNNEILTDKDCENVYELVYSSHRQVAAAAGEFLNTKLYQKNAEATQQEPKTVRGKVRSPNTPLMRDFIFFFIESELHEHAAYLVDSMWDVNDMMKDWGCMTDLLLEEPGAGEEALDDRIESSLIEVMVCCVKQAGTGEYPVGRGPSNRKLSAKENRQVLDDKARLTEHFIQTLPDLLSKYGADAEKAANLLLIPQRFDLEIYTTGRFDKQLQELLEQINEITERHVDEEVLEGCAKCYEMLCSEEFPIANRCEVSKGTLIDSLVQRLKESYTAFFQGTEDPNADDAFNLLAAMKRLHAYYSCHDLSGWNIAGIFFVVVKNGVGNPQINPEVMCKAVVTCTVAVMWHLQSLDPLNPDGDGMRRVRKEVSDFIALCRELLFHEQEVVCEEAYLSICDLLIVFGRQLAQNPVMSALVFEPDSHLAGQLSDFISERVFIEDDQLEDVDESVKIEELHKRRNFLASFSKLIVYNVLHIRHAAQLFQNYLKFYNDYGDIIKTTLGKAREINKVVTSKTMALGLIQQYKEVLSNSGGVLNADTDGFQGLKELARRFNLSFGLDQVKVREAIANIHKEGIQFALGVTADGGDGITSPGGAPEFITFFDVLGEFVNKLMRQDKRVVLQYLDQHISERGFNTKGPDWKSLHGYRGMLSEDDEHVAPPSASRSASGRGRNKGKGTRRVTHMSEVIETPARDFDPQMASTAQKGKGSSETPTTERAPIRLKIKSIPMPEETPSPRRGRGRSKRK